MGEHRHGTYQAVAGAIAAGGLAWLLAHEAKPHTLLDAHRVGAGVLVLVAAVIFAGEFFSFLAGLRSTPKSPNVRMNQLIRREAKKAKRSANRPTARPPDSKAPVSAPAVEQAIARPIGDRRRATLRETLQALLTEGVELKDRIPSSTVMRTIAPLMNFATEDDGVLWEERVAAHLRHDPERLARFQAARPVPVGIQAIATVWQNPLHVRIEGKVKNLAQVIRSLGTT